jgi:hypothetical protein
MEKIICEGCGSKYDWSEDCDDCQHPESQCKLCIEWREKGEKEKLCNCCLNYKLNKELVS